LGKEKKSNRKIYYAWVLKTLGFMDEYHDIYDLEIYGTLTLELRFHVRIRMQKKYNFKIVKQCQLIVSLHYG
jgi:hypothetical protein